MTGILIDGQKLVVANVGDSRAVMSRNGVAHQLSVDHEPSKERKDIEKRGGFVSNMPGEKKAVYIYSYLTSYGVYIDFHDALQGMYHELMDS